MVQERTSRRRVNQHARSAAAAPLSPAPSRPPRLAAQTASRERSRRSAPARVTSVRREGTTTCSSSTRARRAPRIRTAPPSMEPSRRMHPLVSPARADERHRRVQKRSMRALFRRALSVSSLLAGRAQIVPLDDTPTSPARRCAKRAKLGGTTRARPRATRALCALLENMAGPLNRRPKNLLAHSAVPVRISRRRASPPARSAAAAPLWPALSREQRGAPRSAVPIARPERSPPSAPGRAMHALRGRTAHVRSSTRA